MAHANHKHRILKLLISFCLFTADYVRRLGLSLVGKKDSATCVILYYHSITDADQAVFAHQMDTVRALSTPIPVDEITGLLPGKRYVGITFDDGFENNIDNVVPELHKRRIPATFFLTVGFLGQHASWWPEDAPERRQRIASAERWLQVPADLVSIGSHSVTHPHFPLLTEEEAKRELHDSRSALETCFRRKITTFSFPYGEFTPNQALWSQEAGYERSFTTIPQIAFRTTDEYLTGRVATDPSDWDVEFRLKLMGAYRWLPVAMYWKHRIRTLISPICTDSGSAAVRGGRVPIDR